MSVVRVAEGLPSENLFDACAKNLVVIMFSDDGNVRTDHDKIISRNVRLVSRS